MTTMRRRREFAALVLTKRGRPVTEGYVHMEIETSINGRVREHRWSGKISSLTAPAAVLHGPYQLRPLDRSDLFPIQVVQGAGQRFGITSDEYLFLGEGDPPEIAAKGRNR